LICFSELPDESFMVQNTEMQAVLIGLSGAAQEPQRTMICSWRLIEVKHYTSAKR
jgi:hypothetical protein